MVLDMSWFGAMSGPPPHPRLSRVPRWCAPHPWDAFVAGACAYFCFGGPVVLFLLGLAPFLFLPMLLFLPLLLGAYWLLELAWFVHRWYLRYRHEPWTDPRRTPTGASTSSDSSGSRTIASRAPRLPLRWFRGADARLIRRENVREFVRYGFYGGVDGPMSAPEEEEIEWFVSEVERVWAVSFAPGKTGGPAVHAPCASPCESCTSPSSSSRTRTARSGSRGSSSGAGGSCTSPARTRA